MSTLLELKNCTAEDCGHTANAPQELCIGHYYLLTGKIKYGTVCIVVDCDKEHLCKGYCLKHYHAERSAGHVSRNHFCTEEACTQAFYAKGMCRTHYLLKYRKRKSGVRV